MYAIKIETCESPMPHSPYIRTYIYITYTPKILLRKKKTRTKWRRFYAQTYTTHNSTSNITYWHIYLNKFLTNQNNMWRTYFFRKKKKFMCYADVYAYHFPNGLFMKKKKKTSPLFCVICLALLLKKGKKKILTHIEGDIFWHVWNVVWGVWEFFFGGFGSELVIEETHFLKRLLEIREIKYLQVNYWCQLINCKLGYRGIANAFVSQCISFCMKI